uniref:Uncharacterized protein n=1 Tax=Setaria italica TaxID=4555 RepID=K3XPZ2_SETIT
MTQAIGSLLPLLLLLLFLIYVLSSLISILSRLSWGQKCFFLFFCYSRRVHTPRFLKKPQ